MRTFLKWLIGSFALVALFYEPALAAFCPNCIVTVGSISAMQGLGTASAQYPTVNVLSYYAAGTTGGGTFNLTTPCPVASTDSGIYFFPTGVSSGCYVRQTNGTGQFSADWFGVVPNVLGTDYTLNFKSCLTAVEAAHSATGQAYTCAVDPGGYQQTAQLVLTGNSVHFVCASGSWTLGCSFYQMSNYTGLSTAGAMVIGDNASSLFGTTIEGMDIEFTSPGGAFAGSVGMTSYGCNDMCGFQRNFVNGPNGQCFVVRDSVPSSTNTYIFKNNTCFGAQSGTVTGPLFLFENGTYPGEVNNIDGFCYASHCPTNGIEYNNLPAVGQQITLEGPFTNGIQVDASAPFTNITNAVVQFHNTSGNVINIATSSSATDSVYLAGLERCCGVNNGTNSIVDGGSGLGYSATITDISPPPYTRGPSQYTNTTATKVNTLTYGTNGGREGTFVCNGATPVVVSNGNATANDVIAATLKSIGGSQGAQPVVTAISAATSFTIVCTAGDTSTYNYVMIGHP